MFQFLRSSTRLIVRGRISKLIVHRNSRGIEMCGRFSLTAPAKQIESLFKVVLSQDLEPRYNIAPTQPVMAIRLDKFGNNRASMLRWGLIPFWAKDESMGNRCFNARGETAASKASFREPMQRRRCLIPASGFFEWSKVGKARQPTYLHFVEGLGAFAGVWDLWKGPDGPIVSCSIVTTTPNNLVEPLHDRMPVVVSPHDYASWLDPATSSEKIRPLIRPAPEDIFETWAVSQAVNSAANEGPHLIEPAEGI